MVDEATTGDPPKDNPAAGVVAEQEKLAPSAQRSNSTGDPKRLPELTVNFAEPQWHKERLQQVSEHAQRLSQAQKKTRSSIIGVVIIGTLTLLAYAFDWPSAVKIALVVLDVFAALSLLGNYTSEREIVDALRSAESIAKVSAALFGQKSGPEHNYFESLVSINVENLREYYLLVKKHTSYSYRVSLAAGALGFLLICGALMASYVRGQLTSITYIGTGAGLVVEFISGIFFYLYNKTVRQLKGYHDSLLDVQNILLALKLIESVSKEDARSPMLQHMISFLMTRRGLSPESLATEFATAGQGKKKATEA